MRFHRSLVIVVLAGLLATGAVAFPGLARHASAASALQLSRYKAAAGDSITATANGFAAGDDVVVGADLLVNGKPQRLTASAPADGGGTATATMTLPGGTAQGTYTVTARDFHGHAASTHLQVLPLAYLQVGGKVNTAYVIPMHELYISGTGFQANESVSLSATFPQFNGNSVVLSRSVQADGKGAFSEVDVRIPRDVKPGAVTLQATGQTSKKTAKGTLQVVYRPYLTLSSGTVRPGTAIGVHGREFVPDSSVTVSLTIPRTSGTNVTLNRTVTANGVGAFDTTLDLPGDVASGKYSIVAVDGTGHYRATISITVSVHPTITLSPTTVAPGEAIDVSGENFASGVALTVSASFPLQGGGSRTVSTTTTTGGRGNYAVRLGIPTDAAAGQVTVTAHAGSGTATAKLTVQERATATPTSTGTPGPTSTAMPTSTNTPPHHGFGFEYVSIWYHTIRAGTWDYLGVQSTLHQKLGIWVHVWFPSGIGSLAWFQNTDNNGFWHMKFSVPVSAFSPNNSRVIVTVRLWHGKDNRRWFGGFTLIH